MQKILSGWDTPAIQTELAAIGLKPAKPSFDEIKFVPETKGAQELFHETNLEGE